MSSKSNMSSPPRIEGHSISQSQTTRRGFLRVGAGAAAAAAAVSFAAPYVRAADRTGSGAVITGSGGHKFEVLKQWGQLPDGVRYGTTHGIAVDSQNRIYVHNMSEHGTIVFDADGKFIKSWGADFRGGAHGIDIIKEGSDEFCYCSDMGRRMVFKTTLEGEKVRYFPMPEIYENLNQYRPTNITPLPGGDIIVADGYGSSYMHRYTRHGKYITSFSGPGTEPGKTRTPHGLWLDTRGESPILAVCDRENHRLQLFDLDGRHLRFVTDGIRRPCDIDVRGDELLVADINGVVTILDRDYKVITHLGDNPDVWKQQGWGSGYPAEKLEVGKFVTPHDACFDHEGNIYVAEWLNYGRITKLRRLT